uniref:Uncharacterized protein n=1 Tax=Plectus sambesii TaxID=2011161 RepID=A0A914VME4_9BILA
MAARFGTVEDGSMQCWGQLGSLGQPTGNYRFGAVPLAKRPPILQLLVHFECERSRAEMWTIGSATVLMDRVGQTSLSDIRTIDGTELITLIRAVQICYWRDTLA